MSSLQKEMFKKQLHPTPEITEPEEEDQDELAPLPTEAASNNKLSPNQFKSRSKYEAVSWDAYFDSYEDVAIPGTQDVFRVYKIDSQDTTSPLFVMHHGAGHSGLSFAVTSYHIKQLTGGTCGVIALDARGHGNTRTEDDTDFSLGRLSDDLVNVIQELQKDKKQDLILVGHSMGGSVVVDVTQRKQLPNIVGVCVLDVVEGSAMDALSSMTKILTSRPQHFASVEQAIQWSVKSDTLRNLESAKVSVPSLVVPSKDSSGYSWRTDLTKTTPFWTEWFADLSAKFLGSPAAKLLILAGTDRLDKPLTIAQMQGKFQLHIFPDSGHFLQEDAPEKTAQCLVDFWKRNKRLVLPSKVQIPPKQ